MTWQTGIAGLFPKRSLLAKLGGGGNGMHTTSPLPPLQECVFLICTKMLAAALTDIDAMGCLTDPGNMEEHYRRKQAITENILSIEI